MTKLRKLLSLAAVSMLIAVSASCDSASQITAVDSGVELDAQFANANRAGGATRLAWVNVESGEVVGAWFAAGGGTLELRSNGAVVARLVVNGGVAPGDWTRFTMELTDNALVLTATRWGSDVVNDVGNAGFRKGVKLYLNPDFIRTTDGAFPNSVGIALLNADDSLSPIASQLDSQTGFVVGTLTHFSAYVPISD